MATKFNRFDDISHTPLRAYNRAVLFSNIFQDHGKASAEDYANSFTREERVQMGQVIELVRERGKKFVQTLVTSGVDFPDYPSVEVV
jgi:hypothetical protein